MYSKYSEYKKNNWHTSELYLEYSVTKGHILSN